MSTMHQKSVSVIFHPLFHIDCINSLVRPSRSLAIDDLPSFTIVNTVEAGDGIVNVKIKQNGNRLVHEQIQLIPHIYEISFLPETTDPCFISIAFNGENNCKFAYRSKIAH